MSDYTEDVYEALWDSKWYPDNNAGKLVQLVFNGKTIVIPYKIFTIFCSKVGYTSWVGRNKR